MMGAEQNQSIDGRTQVIPILAYPSDHLRTPGFFNAYCSEHDLNAVMVPWRVRPEDLKSAFNALRRIDNVPGAVVTIPHKTEVAKLCDELEGTAAEVGVCNAIHKNAEGRLVGRMLDGVGFIQGLRDQGIRPEGKSALLFGAGGAATAIAFELLVAGVHKLAIINRSVSKSAALAQRLSSQFRHVPIEANPTDWEGYELVINGTSLGLSLSDPLPFNPSRLSQSAVVAEVVMKPDITPLLEQSRSVGLRIHRGVHMVMSQIPLLVTFTLRGN